MAQDDGSVEFLDATEAADAEDAPRSGPHRRVASGLAALSVAAALAAGIISSGHHGKPGSRPSPAPTTAVGPLPGRAHPVTVTGLGHPVLAAPIGEQLYLRAPNYVARIDLGRGVITRSAIPTIPDTEAVSLVVRAGGVLLRPVGAIGGYLIPDSGGARRPPGLLTAPAPAWPAAREGQTWIDADGRIVLVDELGRPLGPRMPVPFGANPLGGWPDGGGGLLFQTAQGWYTAAPAGTALVTSGDMVAIGRSRLLVARCVREGCRQVVVDRRTGRRTVLHGSYSGLTGLPGVVSPDGTVASYADFPSSLLELTDLRTGDALLVPLRCKGDAQSMAWAPDSRQLFVIDRTGSLMAVQPDTGRTVDLTALAGGPVEQVAVRAAGG